MENSETGDAIMGVMVESNLEEGRQDIGPNGREGLRRGVSVTDGKHLATVSATITDSPGSLHRLADYDRCIGPTEGRCPSEEDSLGVEGVLSIADVVTKRNNVERRLE